MASTAWNPFGKRAEWANILIVMYSANLRYERMQEARQLGADDYVVKSAIGWEDFVSLVRRQMRQRSVRCRTTNDSHGHRPLNRLLCRMVGSPSEVRMQ